MKRTKSDARKNVGFYIAVCCCVLVIAIVGYVNKTATKKDAVPQDSTEKTLLKVGELPSAKPEKADASAAVKKPAVRAAAPKEEDAEPVSLKLFGNDPAFKADAPVAGKVIGKFSGDQLVFHEASGDWRTHNGIDLAAKDGESVRVCADGVVEKVYADSMGNSVLVDHGNGFQTVYANLAEVPAELAGKNVKAGDEIGKVSSSALSDLTSEPHLHFEVIRENQRTDPMEYMK